MLTWVNSWSTLVNSGKSLVKSWSASCMLHVQGYPKIQTCNCHGLGNLYMHPNPKVKLCFIICSLMWIHTDVNGWIMCVSPPSVSTFFDLLSSCFLASLYVFFFFFLYVSSIVGCYGRVEEYCMKESCLLEKESKTRSDTTVTGLQ